MRRRHSTPPTLCEIFGWPISRTFVVPSDPNNDYAEEMADGQDPRIADPIGWTLLQLDHEIDAERFPM